MYVQQEFIPRNEPQFSTGVPAFIGKPARARELAPVRIALWSQYRSRFADDKFGGELDLLSYAVRGFFENGGQACYVVPVRDSTLAKYREALERIEGLEQIDLVSVPEYPVDSGGHPDRAAFSDLQGELVTYCRRLGDRFALLDPLPGQSPDDVSKTWDSLEGGYAALYYPWLRVPGVSGRLVNVPPSPYAAGIISRVDRRSGPGEAPANEDVEGVADVVLPNGDTELDLAAQAQLSKLGVNFIQPLRGRGLRLWGARTLSGDRVWRYINVRRVVISVLRWIRENMRDVPFEPNGPRLWARIDREVTSHLMSLYRSGTLKGRSPEEAFYVHTSGADERTAETCVGVAPAVPFEFIVVRLIHGESGVVLSTPEAT